MKTNTIRWRIFKNDLVLITMLIIAVAIIFNFTVRIYLQREMNVQLTQISSRAENTALKQGASFLSVSKSKKTVTKKNKNTIKLHSKINRTLKQTSSVINAEYILLDVNMNKINLNNEELKLPNELLNKIKAEIQKNKAAKHQKQIQFKIKDSNYIAIINPVSLKNNFGLGWIVIYSNLKKINQLTLEVNILLIGVLLLSAFIMAIVSSIVSNKITEPFNTLNKYISSISERNFGTNIDIPVYGEIQELVNSTNLMSQRLSEYDKAQKTFLQNASHELRTPLTAIQSYAEGIKYGVVDNKTAVEVIIDESKRLTDLVEDILYLSRLDAIEEAYHYEVIDFKELMDSCIERMNGIAIKESIKIVYKASFENLEMYVDSEKLSRCIINIISNCIRYAKTTVEVTTWVMGDKLEILVTDDGPGFDKKDINNIFQRFYKGEKGKYGLGLAISKSVIEKHNGTITADNTGSGAEFKIELPS